MNKKQSKKGIVYLAGAGPGDAGLLTLKAAQVLSEADVIIYDRLIAPDILQLNQHGEKIYAGKNKGTDSDEKSGQHQAKINRILVRNAQQGKKVVRLKGGDPFIFGRGGEEAHYLAQHRIPFEIIPGITAGYAAPAYAGIPVTDRRYASEVIFVTAHEVMKTGSGVDWELLAKFRGTIVLFMGIKTMPQVLKRLIRAGKSKETKISVIQWGTLPEQKIAEGTLANISREVKRQGLGAPAVMVIGEINRLRHSLSWFQKRPLSGKNFLVTRARLQSGAFKRKLENLGARVIEAPVIETLPPRDFKPLDDAIRFIDRYHWVLFTSVNGVESFFQRLHFLGFDLRHLGRIKVGAIGEATRQLLQTKGILADLVPPQFTSESLVAALQKVDEIQSKIFLLPRTDIAPEALKQALERLGAGVHQVVAYRTVLPASAGNQLKNGVKNEKIDGIIFTSASTVHNFFRLVKKSEVQKRKLRLISIGPVTSSALWHFGVRPYAEAKVHTLEGVTDCLLTMAKNRQKKL